jgi:hypothetical protein
VRLHGLPVFASTKMSENDKAIPENAKKRMPKKRSKHDARAADDAALGPHPPPGGGLGYQ